MTFRVPLPIVSRKPPVHLNSSLLIPVNGLPSFQKRDFSDVVLIGEGSFGKVYKGNKNGATFVIKQLVDGACNKLLVKEAEVLKAVAGHDNIVEIHGLSLVENSLLLNFVSFSFAVLGIDHESVSCLKEFMSACASLSDNSFTGFQHLPFHIACDIMSGLSFLHSKGIAHRDLKPANVLVSNQHYDKCASADISFYWTHKPVVAKLTDFGESRSEVMQTHSVVSTRTSHLRRGSPAFWSPEVMSNNNGLPATMHDLIQSDIWALGMTIYSLINPDIRHPYAEELSVNKTHLSSMEKLQQLLLAKQLPVFSKAYQSLHKNQWAPLVNVFYDCTCFEPSERLTVKTCLQNFVNGCVVIQPLSTSQGIPGNMSLHTSDIPVNNTVNACAFLALLVASNMQQNPATGQSINLADMATFIMSNFPQKVNDVRDVDSEYSVHDAYNILRQCNVIDQCDLEVVLNSTGDKLLSVANDEIMSKLADLCVQYVDGSFYATYTCPPYVVLICKPEGLDDLFVIDTHAVSPDYGGFNTGVIVTAAIKENSINALCKWLFARFGCKENVRHELTVVKISNLASHAVTSFEHDVRNNTISQGLSPHVRGTPQETATEDVEESLMNNSILAALRHSEDLKMVSNWSGSANSQSNVEDISHDSMESHPVPANVSDDSEQYAESESYELHDGQEYFPKRRHVNIRNDISNWNSVDLQCVLQLPVDIDGLCTYRLDCSRETMMTVTKDGRPWKVWSTSGRKGFHGIRRIAHCKGTSVCPNDECPFLTQFQMPNKVQFSTTAGVRNCFICGAPVLSVPCACTKVWEYATNSTFVTVMHCGNHSCTIKKAKCNKATIVSALSNRPGVKPCKVVGDKMADIMACENFSWEEIDKVAENFADMKRVHNIRYSLNKQNDNMGHNFEAVGVYKTKCDQKDQFLLYRVNNRALNGQSSYVFKSSKAMAQLCLEMDASGQSAVNESFAYVDAKHDRCRGFKTITLWMFHPVYRKILSLAVMDAEKEDTENLTTFWKLVNEMLQTVSGNSQVKFNPTGFSVDENHANWTSIRSVYGEHMIKRVTSCEFHFQQSVCKHGKKLSPSDEKTFTVLANSLLNALTEGEFAEACKHMTSFVDCHDQLKSWYKWWYDRRTHIFRLFKPANAPSSNLAEIGHAKMESYGRSHMTLLEAARQDVAAAIRQEVQLRLFVSGLSKGGRGPNENDRRTKQHNTAMKQAIAFSNELDQMTGNSEHGIFVPATGKHRPPTNRGQKRKANNLVRPQPDQQIEPTNQNKKTFHLITYSTVVNLKKCYGCQKVFRDKYKIPPHDVILKHYCYRMFKNKDGHDVRSKQLQATYFHLNYNCVRKVVPTMELRHVLLHDDVKIHLSDDQRKVLRKFGFFI